MAKKKRKSKKPKMTKKEKSARARLIWRIRRKNHGKTGLKKKNRAKK